MQRILVFASLVIFALSLSGCGLEAARQQQMAAEEARMEAIASREMAQRAEEQALANRKLADEQLDAVLKGLKAEEVAHVELQAAQTALKAAQEELKQVKAELEQAKAELVKLKAKPETGTL